MLKILHKIVWSVFSLITSIFRPLKRLWCRRRKDSESDLDLPTIVSGQSMAIDIPQSFPGQNEAEYEIESWDNWDTTQPATGQTTQSAIGQLQYNQSNSLHSNARAKPGSIATQMTNSSLRGRRAEPEPESEPEPDYFQDMIPEVKRPAKILIKKKEDTFINTAAISSRLSASADDPPLASELESWEEDPSAWAEEITEDLSWEAEAAIREKRKAERQERTLEQQRKKQQRDAARGMKKDTHIAVKIS